MSSALIAPVLLIFNFAWKAYASTKVEVPIIMHASKTTTYTQYEGLDVGTASWTVTLVPKPVAITTVSPARRVYKGEEEYDKVVAELPGADLKVVLQPLLARAGVRRDLIIAEHLNPGYCCAQGTNFFTKGDAFISVMPGFSEVDREACTFIVKHEISHIKNNDCFTISLIPAIASVAAFGVAFFTFSRNPATIVTLLTGFVTNALFSRYCESRADDFAIAVSSPEELRGARRFFISLQEVNKKSRKTAFDRVVVSPSGEERLDILHPSTRSRLAKVEKALKARDIVVGSEEVERIAKLRDLMDRTRTEVATERNKETAVRQLFKWVFS
jgi:hypothetical protein